jgi:hypothetical protein
VALGGSEAFLTRDLSERQFLFEILAALGGSSSNLVLGGRENIMAAIITAAGGSVSPHEGGFNVLLAELVVALGGDPVSASHSSLGELLAAAVNAADTGGGGGGDYVAGSVHFDGTTWLINSGLVASDSDIFSMTGWAKFTNSPNNTLWVVDPQDTYQSAANDDGSTFLYGEGSSLNVVPAGGNPGGTWFSFVFSANTTTLESKLYINDIDVTQQSGAAPFMMSFSGLPFWFGNDDSATGCVSDFADVRIMPNVSLLTAGDIPEATRRWFVSPTNKPVDPATATAALGAAGAVLFSGDASTFVTNQGIGGSFSLVGSISNAASSPSD